MATNIYTIGEHTYSRHKRQGAPTKPDALKRRNLVAIRLTDAEYAEYKMAKSRSFLSPSEFGALVIALGIGQLFVTDNCSKK